jgi:hypothetical protein
MWFSDKLSVLRPSFEVVKEGRILKKIKHIQTLLGVICYRVAGFGRKLGVYIQLHR